mmetsp:Transcript_11470/g.24191  ORF Transcript_11470/g.24191 Transcript_11470/m.24191 type:complete len:127 (+) Transcript_11470:563-943(+)
MESKSVRGTSETVGNKTAPDLVAYRLATKRESPVARALFHKLNKARTSSLEMSFPTLDRAAFLLREKKLRSPMFNSVAETGASTLADDTLETTGVAGANAVTPEASKDAAAAATMNKAELENFILI